MTSGDLGLKFSPTCAEKMYEQLRKKGGARADVFQLRVCEKPEASFKHPPDRRRLTRAPTCGGYPPPHAEDFSFMGGKSRRSGHQVSLNDPTSHHLFATRRQSQTRRQSGLKVTGWCYRLQVLVGTYNYE